MKVVDKLLEDIKPQDLLDHESYVQLHLKQIMTTINKHKLEDISTIKVLRNIIGRPRSINAISIAMTSSSKGRLWIPIRRGLKN